MSGGKAGRFEVVAGEAALASYTRAANDAGFTLSQWAARAMDAALVGPDQLEAAWRAGRAAGLAEALAELQRKCRHAEGDVAATPSVGAALGRNDSV